MKLVLNILKHKWVIRSIGLIALCTLIWMAGPMITIAGKTPLSTPWLRILAILSVLNLCLVFGLVAQIRAKRADQKLMAQLASPQDSAQTAVDEAKDKERADLQNTFEQSLQLLKSTFKGRRYSKKYLYELPWYVIIGTPGSGKTTLLANSGLTFPLDKSMGRADIQGVGGTRNCTWMFAEEAVFLDTAGRYTTQDSHQPVDASAWHNFLALIKTYRKQRPINGVFISLSVADLLQWSEPQVKQYAQTIRERTSELHHQLGIQFPIYLLLTKCDLISGFTEFFADLDQGRRRQVWGETFSDAHPDLTGKNMARFENRFEGLIHQLRRRILKRCQSESDIQRRGQILDFPEQVARLKPSIMRFLKHAFGTNRYDTEKYFLRGVYFTSGTQEGTPIDRVMGQLAATYGFDRQDQPLLSGRGRSYFIHRLLTQVVFAEAELAGLDLHFVRRCLWIRGAAYAGLLTLVVGMTVLWCLSYVKNQQAIQAVAEHVAHYEVLSNVSTSKSNNAHRLLERLNTVFAADRIFSQRSWWEGFGLYQGDKLQSGIHRLYARLLGSDLLPVTRQRLGTRISQLLNASGTVDLERLYDLLKTYLLLGRPEKMALHRTFAKEQMHREWIKGFAREPQLQAQMGVHLDHLCKTPIVPRKPDQVLVQHARRKLNAIPLARQIYTHLKSQAQEDPSLDIYLKDVLGPHGQGVFTTDKEGVAQTLHIPGLFTHQGYHTFFKKHGLSVIDRALDQNWVVQHPQALQIYDADRLYDDLEKLYFSEYHTRWHQALHGLDVIKPKGLHQAIHTIDQMSGPKTPLRPLLDIVAKNTRFGLPAAVKSSSSQNKLGDQNIFAGAKAQAEALVPSLPAPALGVTRNFQPLSDMVASQGEAPAPLDHVLATLTRLRDFMMQTSSISKMKMARGRMTGAGADDMLLQTRMAFHHLPEPLKTWLLALIDGCWGVTLNTAASEMNTIWKRSVWAPYRQSLNKRYPLFKNSPVDATLADFSSFFKPDGIFDQFFKNHLKSFVDTTPSNWVLHSRDHASLDISSRALTQFQYANQIQKHFFAVGGSGPSIQFDLKPIFLDESVLWFKLNLQGQSMQYSHGPAQPQTFKWPGPQPHLGVLISFMTLDGKQIRRFEQGPWAWLRTLDAAEMKNTAIDHLFHITFAADGVEAQYEMRAATVFNPFKATALSLFRCPEGL